MELRFFTNSKIEQGFVLINKYGAIRFKKEFAEVIGFKKDQRWLIGYDKEETPTKHLYIVKPPKEYEGNGFKVCYQNKSWFITCKTLLAELKLEFPTKCRMEKWKNQTHEGIKLILPNP